MYKIFDKFVVRTPSLSINYFFDLTKIFELSDEDLIREFKDPNIREAIYLASPVLYRELEKCEEFGFKSETKIRESFLKYLSRMSSRCTPFGLFSGCYLDSFEQKKMYRIKMNNNRTTRIDMNLTGLLIQKIENDIEIRKSLKFFVNTSLYKIGDLFRFIESTFIGNLLTYKLIELEYSEYIDRVIEFCKEGQTISDITAVIIDEEIEAQHAIDFINELIISQVLVSEIKLSVSGEESFNSLINVLSNKNINKELINTLLEVKYLLNMIDIRGTNEIRYYNDILTLLKSIPLDFEEKFVFQTDLIVKKVNLKIDENVENDLIDVLGFINKVSPFNEKTNLTSFKKAFYERYETREMPLSTVLDDEIGLGYPINSYKSGLNSLINDLNFNQTIKTDDLNLNKFQSLLLKKMTDLKMTDGKEIEFFDTDIADFVLDEDKLPLTFSTIAQVIKTENSPKIFVESFFATSSTSILGRFCHSDSEINSFVKEIVDYEDSLNSDVILAEIVHLPENRVGNILLRPEIRKYEIPYLSNSSKQKEYKIRIEDILVAVRNHKLILIHKFNRKEILPRLANAHNSRTSSLPIYRFLCDMQFNNVKSDLFFDYSILIRQFSYCPRVVYKNIILSTEKWMIKTTELKRILKENKQGSHLIIAIEKWRKEYKIPQYIYIVNGDNKLLINFLNLLSIKVLFTEIKEKSSILIEEFLFADELLLNKNLEKNFVNEIIFSFYKN